MSSGRSGIAMERSARGMGGQCSERHPDYEPPCDSLVVVRTLVTTFLSVVLALIIGVCAAAGLAAFRGGQFSVEFAHSLWIVGCLMLLLTMFSFSPSTRHAQ